jgi:hypothetical protein
MPHQPTKGSLQDLFTVRAIAFYVLLLVATSIIAFFLYNYLATPIVSFDKYGFTTLHAVPISGYKEEFLDEPLGRAVTVGIGLPAGVAREEAESTVIKTMEELYRRRPDVDVITVVLYYSYTFGQPRIYSLGTATWGPNGNDTPVVHTRKKADYKITFRWTTMPWTIDERSLAESKRQMQQQKQEN